MSESISEKTKAQFQKEVANHEMTILRDHDLYRHVRFQEKGTRICGFDLITWPGHLTISGDCGTYTFARLMDMFDFFRNDKPLSINPNYWGEKMLSIDRNGGYLEFSKEVLEETVASLFDNWKTDAGLSEEDIASTWRDIQHEILTAESIEEVFSNIRDYEDPHELFTDFWEYDLTEYTHNFLWNLYAISWGVQQYDAHKRLESQPVVAMTTYRQPGSDT